MKINFEFVNKEVEKAGVDVCCRNAEKGYLDGKLINGTFCFVQVLNEHETEIRLNKFGAFKTIVPSTEVFNLLVQMSK